MIFQESETVELKEIVVDGIKKEIIAFANSDGGKLYIGIGDDGSVVGLDNPDDTALQVSNMVRDAIKPDITMFLHYDVLKIEGKNVLCIDIQRGTNRPYYLAKKGMRPEGVYTRQGFSSVPATDSAIRQMIKDTDGERFESMRSLNQDLDFQCLKSEFSLRNIDLGLQQMRTLKLINSEGLYTNLALLLSQECVHTIKVAVFQGSNQKIFKDRREFKGSLLHQMHDVYDFIDIHNHTYATVEKLLRVDSRDYPEIAIREALLNLLVHCDYSFSSSPLISIYEDKIEFVSIGGLIPGIDLEDVMMGISICRNPDLANIFYRLHLIEAYGTGLSKIMDSYSSSGKEPIFEVSRNAFKVVLPNINRKKDIHDSIEVMEQTPVYSAGFSNRRKSEDQLILDYAKVHDTFTKNDIVDLLEVSPATASRILLKMVTDKQLVRIGKAKRTRYTIA